MVSLEEQINKVRNALDGINTSEDYIRHGLNANHSDTAGLRGIIGILRAGGETYTSCVNIRDFFDRFSIETEERDNGLYFIMPNIKGVKDYENEPWYADLRLLLNEGYCTPKKDYIHPIFNACGKLSVTVGYRSYFGLDYIVCCGEFDRHFLKRYDCLAYFLEKAKSELREYSQDCTWKTPKPGSFKEWVAAAFRYERLRQMLDEIYHRHNDFEDIIKIYVGTVGGWSTGVTKTEDPHPFIENIDFSVEYTSNAYSGLEDKVNLRIEHNLGIEWFINHYYDVERHNRYDEGKSTVLRAYVDNINVIRRLEWVEE